MKINLVRDRKEFGYPDKSTKVHLPPQQNEDGSDTVFIEVDGEHGSFINNKSIKEYFIAGGELVFNVNGKETKVSQGDLITVFINEKHSMQGTGCFFLRCNPAFDPATEVRL